MTRMVSVAAAGMCDVHNRDMMDIIVDNPMTLTSIIIQFQLSFN